MSDHGLMHRDGLGDLLTCLPRCEVGTSARNARLETAPAATPNAGSYVARARPQWFADRRSSQRPAQ